MSSNTKYTKINIELRRAEVLRLLSQGYSQRLIAEKLNVSNALISGDVRALKEQAREDLRSHFQDRLPYEFARSMAGINDVLRRATELRDRMTDPKLQLQAMSLMAQLYGQIMNMASDGGVIQAAFEKVEKLSNHELISRSKEPQEQKVEESATFGHELEAEDLEEKEGKEERAQ